MSDGKRRWAIVVLSGLAGVCAFGAYLSLSRYLRDKAEAAGMPSERLSPFITAERLREKLGRGVSLIVGSVVSVLGIVMVSIRRGFAYKQPFSYCLAQWLLIMAIRSLVQQDWLWGGLALFGVIFLAGEYLVKRGPPVPKVPLGQP